MHVLSNSQKGISSQLFVQMLLEALTMPTNRPVLQQWMDFTLTSLPHFSQCFNTVLVPLLHCICQQLRLWKSLIQRNYAIEQLASFGMESNDAFAADWDIICLLTGLEQITMFCLQDYIAVEPAFSISSQTASVDVGIFDQDGLGTELAFIDNKVCFHSLSSYRLFE
jgi:hypothetical protein